MEKSTITAMILDALRRYDRPDLLRFKREGRWQALSSRAFLRRVASLAATLKELGVQKGDRVGLFSENRSEWHIADLAILGLGGVNVPIYPAESAERLEYILEHSEARVCFVSGPEQFGKVAAVWERLPQLVRALQGGSWIGRQSPARTHPMRRWRRMSRRPGPTSRMTWPACSTPQEPPEPPKECC
jgi:long-subunit acyl-CoA synthetase (AMP-forming)